MITEGLKQLRVAFVLLVLFTILTGMLYPALVTGLAQLFSPGMPMEACFSIMTKSSDRCLLASLSRIQNIFGEERQLRIPFHTMRPVPVALTWLPQILICIVR